MQRKWMLQNCCFHSRSAIQIPVMDTGCGILISLKLNGLAAHSDSCYLFVTFTLKVKSAHSSSISYKLIAFLGDL